VARYARKSRNSRQRIRRQCVPSVHLSKYDLAHLDEAALAALAPEQLRTLSAKLLAKPKLAHERLDRNPRNSSRPPSSMAPWDRAGDKAADSRAAHGPVADDADCAAEAEADGVRGAEDASAAQPPAPQTAPAEPAPPTGSDVCSQRLTRNTVPRFYTATPAPRRNTAPSPTIM
jgi:hypothetical protein